MAGNCNFEMCLGKIVRVMKVGALMIQTLIWTRRRVRKGQVAIGHSTLRSHFLGEVSKFWLPMPARGERNVDFNPSEGKAGMLGVLVTLSGVRIKH